VTEEDDVIRVQGTVAQNLPNAMFKVEIDGGLEVLAHVSGKNEDAAYPDPSRRQGRC
jgi:translation initiation factor IF-1